MYIHRRNRIPNVGHVYDYDKVSANKWDKTVTMPSLAVGQSFTGRTSLYQFPLGGGQSVSVTRIKIEKGNKATDWTPAPEDKLSEGVSYAGVVINATNGFVSTATIDSQTITTKSNSTEGFSIYNGTDKVFGVDTDGALFASRIAYIDNPERYYGIIGDFPGAGTGLALFDADKSANAYVKMGAIYDGSGNLAGFGFANIDSVLRMYFGNGATEILNATGTKGILTYLDSTNEIYIMYGGASAHVGARANRPILHKKWNENVFLICQKITKSKRQSERCGKEKQHGKERRVHIQQTAR